MMKESFPYPENPPIEIKQLTEREPKNSIAELYQYEKGRLILQQGKDRLLCSLSQLLGDASLSNDTLLIILCELARKDDAFEAKTHQLIKQLSAEYNFKVPDDYQDIQIQSYQELRAMKPPKEYVFDRAIDKLEFPFDNDNYINAYISLVAEDTQEASKIVAEQSEKAIQAVTHIPEKEEEQWRRSKIIGMPIQLSIALLAASEKDPQINEKIESQIPAISSNIHKLLKSNINYKLTLPLMLLANYGNVNQSGLETSAVLSDGEQRQQLVSQVIADFEKSDPVDYPFHFQLIDHLLNQTKRTDIRLSMSEFLVLRFEEYLEALPHKLNIENNQDIPMMLNLLFRVTEYATLGRLEQLATKRKLKSMGFEGRAIGQLVKLINSIIFNPKDYF